MPSLDPPSWADLTPAETAILAENLGALETMLTQNGSLSFTDYMEWALYSPTQGYYTHREVFGAQGDYVTAPLLSPLFGDCLARQCAAILAPLGGSIMEIGAGNGRLAVDILKSLGARQTLPDRYWLIERSPLLRGRAQALIAAEIPQWADRVRIVENWPDEQAAVILANELIDALPASRFRMRAGLARPLSITYDGERLGLVEGPPDPNLSAYLQDLALPDGYESETIPAAHGFLKEASDHLTQGIILLVDYGFPQREFYHPERSQGTLMCHFRQRAHPDPLVLPGLQDITCHVDFTALAESGHTHGLALAGYTSQAAFLLSLGLGDGLAIDGQDAIRARQAIKRLTLPHEMGELFKVIAWSRDLPFALEGFRLLDRRRALEA
ncbi:MAG TPA: SAM-dependent methyltransferase [Acidiferrobacter sp.]|nr:SAM-dependent methyltransferase [Acidiferrobacter sp.]